MNTAITAKANEISAKVSSVETTLKNNYSTTNEMNSAINAKANAISASVSSTYATKGALNSATNRISSLETWKKEASIQITDSSIISTVISSSNYKNSVSSLIAQEASSIRLKADRISWESTYSSMTSSGTLTCRNATISGTLNATSVLTGELQVKSGHIVGYYNGYKGIEITGTRMQVYAWSDLGNYVGSVGSVKVTDTGRICMGVWVNRGDILLIGYDEKGDAGTGEFSSTVYPVIQFNANEGENVNPPWILGGVSGTLTVLYGVSGSTQYKVKITVKNGIITGWST